MELYQLKSFVAVAEEGNLTRAAERLFTSQPAVSAHIKALEEELGVSLFDRTARGMTITSDGEKLWEKASEVLANVGALNELARDLQANPSGSLKIGVNFDGIGLKLDAISESLYNAYPGIQLEFVHSSSGTLAKGLLNGDVDVAFVEGVVDTPLLAGIHIGVNRVVVVGAPKHEKVFASMDWKDLESLPWVFKTPDCSYHQLMTRIAEAHDLALNKQYVIDHEATCLQFVRNGIAISVANENVVSEDIDRGSLIAWQGFRGTLNLRLLCVSKRSQERAIQAFFEAVKRILELDNDEPNALST